jgi:hypothetical protein
MTRWLATANGEERVQQQDADPLDRLARLHQSFQEMTTGLTYRSPFER